MREEELLEKYKCNNLGVFIDQYLTCQVAYDLLKTQFKEIERLNNIINEAIEYIELAVKCTPSSTRKDIANMILINHKVMLDILKGENENE